MESRRLSAWRGVKRFDGVTLEISESRIVSSGVRPAVAIAQTEA